MIIDAIGFAVVILLVSLSAILLAALITIIDQGLDGLITKKIRKRFGGDE